VSELFDEVDEEVRRDQLKKLWDQYSIYIIGLALLIIAGVGGWRGYQYLEAKKAAEAGAAFDRAAELADQNKHAEAEAAFADLAAKARSDRLTLEDLQGGTFTITNGGVFGSMLSTPILNPPQTGILGMHNVVDRPVVREGQVVVRPIMYLALSYDHRLIDGREAVLFLVRIKECVESPERLLLEV